LWRSRPNQRPLHEKANIERMIETTRQAMNQSADEQIIPNLEIGNEVAYRMALSAWKMHY